ncbi:MAG TPA: YARHG domain-containing protein [Hyphomicrobiaceae bacterium]|nr:YARHG domain-containing protein [Hyphomicrobiaceae bacterium]
MFRRIFTAALAVAAFSTTALLPPANASAPFSEYSCNELWEERNGIFAIRGYCFKTERAIARFGRRCYPPYGQLTAQDRRIVEEIRHWERRKGCPVD